MQGQINPGTGTAQHLISQVPYQTLHPDFNLEAQFKVTSRSHFRAKFYLAGLAARIQICSCKYVAELGFKLFLYKFYHL